MRKSTRQLVSKLEAQGWSVGFTNSGHLRATHPDVPDPMIMSGTPSDHRAQANALARAARMIREAQTTTTITEEPPLMYTYVRTGRVSKVWQVTPTGVICLVCGRTHDRPLQGLHLHEDFHNSHNLVTERARMGGLKAQAIYRKENGQSEPEVEPEPEVEVEPEIEVVEPTAPQPEPLPVTNDTVKLQKAYDLIGSILQVPDQSTRIQALEAEVAELRTVLALSREALDMLKGIGGTG